MQLLIPILHGTSRPGNKSIHVARYIESVVKQGNYFETMVVTPSQFELPDDGNKIRDPNYSKLTEKADGFIIVTPEYNHSIPGSLKRMLDSEYKNYAHKAVLLAGVSDGNWGGVRAVEMLVGVVKALDMHMVCKDLYFPLIDELINEQGMLDNPETEERVQRALLQLQKLAQVTKWGREHVWRD